MQTSIIGPENIEAGIVIDKAAPAEFHIRKIKVMQAGHPLPENFSFFTILLASF